MKSFGYKRLLPGNSRRFRCFTLLFLFGPLPGLMPVTAQAERLNFTGEVTVLVYNYRQIPPKILGQAEQVASSIFGTAGIRTVWLHCPISDSPVFDPCRSETNPNLVKLRLLSGPKQNRLLDTVSGAALPPQLAEIYYDYLPRLPRADESLTNQAIILGCSIAHELGHLFLGSYGHSNFGIMQGGWGLEQLRWALMGGLRFMTNESKLIQAELHRREEERRTYLASGTASTSSNENPERGK